MVRAPVLGSALLIPFAFGACDGAGAHADLALADVSFLVPLDAGSSSLTAASVGGHGVLLPRARFDAFEMLTRVDEPDALYGALHVVGVRLDPCFYEGPIAADGATCTSQVRLVLQPVFPAPAPAVGLETRDAAMHAFYAVPEEELRDLAGELAARREAIDAPGEALGVTAIDVADLLLPHLGAARLTRVTAMSVHPTGQAWIFSGQDVHDGVATDLAIRGVNEPDQHLTSKGGRATLDATLLPEPSIEPAIAPFLELARRETLDAEATDDGIGALERLLDPAEHNPGTVDCASCHVATTGLRYATRAVDPERVPAIYDDTSNQRMFGYFFAVPSVSPRVVAESRAALARLSSP
jgi:hypothetical protein